MRFSVVFIVCFAAAGTAALAQSPSPDEAAQMRAAALEKRFPRELPSAIPEARWHAWQPVVPKSLKRSLRPPLAAELRLEAHLAGMDRGHAERRRPATEQLALGLSADPPRPQYPILEAGPRSNGLSLSTFELVQLPPLSRSTDPKLSLSGDPASIATRPYTAARVTASRGPAAPRNDIGIPDPFVIQREAKLPTLPPDTDPPAPSFDVPERPMLPVASK